MATNLVDSFTHGLNTLSTCGNYLRKRMNKRIIGKVPKFVINHIKKIRMITVLQHQRRPNQITLGMSLAILKIIG